MALFLRRNGFAGEDYTVFSRDADGTEHDIGRIFRRMAGQPWRTPWFWAVEFHQRDGRTPPHQGVAVDRESAMAAFKRCWDNADIPTRKPPRKQWWPH